MPCLSCFPCSLAKMREELAEPETVASVKERLTALQLKHRKETAQLFDLQAEDYWDAAEAAYCAGNDGEAWPVVDVSVTASFSLKLVY